MGLGSVDLRLAMRRVAPAISSQKSARCSSVGGMSLSGATVDDLPLHVCGFSKKLLSSELDAPPSVVARDVSFMLRLAETGRGLGRSRLLLGELIDAVAVMVEVDVAAVVAVLAAVVEVMTTWLSMVLMSLMSGASLQMKKCQGLVLDVVMFSQNVIG